MSICSFVARWTTRAAVVAAFAWTGTSAFAADVTAPPAAPAIGAAPGTVGDPGCASCQNGATLGTCSKCNKCNRSLILGAFHQHKASRTPFNVTLCPGACFGYFQTQWRKWDEACPYPYLGTGVSDAPRLPAGVLNPRPVGSDLPAPRPFDPKTIDPKAPKVPDPKTTDPKTTDPKKVGSLELPAIPQVPNKFSR